MTPEEQKKRTVELDESAGSVFAVTKGNGDGVPFVLVGISPAAWEHIRDGNTNHFDLRGLGVNAKLVFFGAADEADAKRTIEAAIGEPVDLRVSTVRH